MQYLTWYCFVAVHIAKDRDTNASRGFAFITFSSSTDCSKACTGMDGKVCLLSRTLLLDVNKCQSVNSVSNAMCFLSVISTSLSINAIERKCSWNRTFAYPICLSVCPESVLQQNS